VSIVGNCERVWAIVGKAAELAQHAGQPPHHGRGRRRLKTIKSKYDPNEVFKFEQSIILA